MSAQHGVREFRDDDANYLAWLAAHRDGYVINILHSHNAGGARVHHAACRTINGQNPRRGRWTWPYVKVCAELEAELDRWEANHLREPILRCGTCHKTGTAARPGPTKNADQAVDAEVPEVRCDVAGPEPDSAAVQAWADAYIRFEPLPVWQKQLRDEIRQRCRKLKPSPEQVLHATFFGAKRPEADVENLVLYNIGTFNVAGHNGIRFEHGGTAPPASDNGEYRYCYSYALAPRSGSFAHWRPGRTLATFDWTDLGAFAGEKKLAQVWLALSRGELEVFERVAPETPFGVRVQVRPPYGHTPVWGGLVKGVFDGVICALQAHTDTPVAPETLERLAKDLPAQREEIERLLRDPRRAVLGEVPRLVSPYRSGVKWDPCDHLCLAGELLAAEPEPGHDHWEIKGEVFRLSRSSESTGAVDAVEE